MVFEFTENKYGVSLELKPQNIAEAAQLLRFANNAKLVKPSIFLSFSDSIYCNIHMEKVKETVQKNSINPKSK